MKLMTTVLGLMVLLLGCATGSSPEEKKANANKETAAALQNIYQEHAEARRAVSASLGYLVCTGNDNYLFAASTGGGVCTFRSKGVVEYYRFATLGAGLGLGFKKVAFLYTFHDAKAMKRFREEGWDAGARAEASARYEQDGGQVAANTSYDVGGVKVFQVALWGAAAQATVQGYKFWATDFTSDVM
ncbi:MAG: hypothetical protein ACRCUH_09710 [Shewanella sp.]